MAREQLRAGRGPSVEKRVQRLAALASLGTTFEVIARGWHEEQKARWTATHAADVLSSLETSVFPFLGRLPLSEITPPLVLVVLRDVERRGAIETAHRIRQRISAARLEAGRGYAPLQFSGADDVEPVWQRVAGGTLRSVSVGYRVHRYEPRPDARTGHRRRQRSWSRCRRRP